MDRPRRAFGYDKRRQCLPCDRLLLATGALLRELTCAGAENMCRGFVVTDRYDYSLTLRTITQRA